jgi:hypothetical protein
VWLILITYYFVQRMVRKNKQLCSVRFFPSTSDYNVNYSGPSHMFKHLWLRPIEVPYSKKKIICRQVEKINKK